MTLIRKGQQPSDVTHKPIMATVWYTDQHRQSLGLGSAFEAEEILVLDAETTGLKKPEICELTIINGTGKVLFTSLIKPRKAIEPEAQAVHGITDEMLANAPVFADVWPQVKEIIRMQANGSLPLIASYGIDFDLGAIRNSLSGANKSSFTRLMNERTKLCLIHEFARVYGDFDFEKQRYKFVNLGNACKEIGFDASHLTAHRAEADCYMALEVLKHLTSRKFKKFKEFLWSVK